MSVLNRDVRSYEGGSVKITDEINLAEEGVSVRYYNMRDWNRVSVSVAASVAGLAGNLRIAQTLKPQEEPQDIDGGPVSLALISQNVAYTWGVLVDGAYLALDFRNATLPATGKLFITILGKQH